MQIIKDGIKENVGKIFFRCEKCTCEFIADQDEWESYQCTIPNIAYAHCPCCGEEVSAEIDNGHKEALYMIEQEKKEKEKYETVEF